MSHWLRQLEVLVSNGVPSSSPPPGRYRLSGKDMLKPDGTPFRLFGMSEGHSVFDTGYFLPTDPALFQACNANYMRLEMHMGFGVADPVGQPGTYTYPGTVDLYDASHPETGYMNPDRLARMLDIADAFTAAGILVGFAFHAKYLRQFFATEPTMVSQMTAAQVYLCGLPRVRDDPLKVLVEHMNEIDPDTGGQTACNTYYLAVIAAVRAVNPWIINIAGPKGGYGSGQLSTCYLTGLANVGYAVDLFVQGNADDQEANQVQRVGDVETFIETFNAYAYIDQTGGTNTSDPTGDYTRSLAAKLVAADIDLCYWEVTAPGTGSGTFHTVQVNDGVNPPTVDTGWQTTIASWGTTYAARHGVARV